MISFCFKILIDRVWPFPDPQEIAEESEEDAWDEEGEDDLKEGQEEEGGSEVKDEKESEDPDPPKQEIPQDKVDAEPPKQEIPQDKVDAEPPKNKEIPQDKVDAEPPKNKEENQKEDPKTEIPTETRKQQTPKIETDVTCDLVALCSSGFVFLFSDL